VLRQPLNMLDYLLIPVRDVVAMLVWAASFAGHTIHWRGLEFRLRNGKLEPVAQNTAIARSSDGPIA